MTIEEVKSYFDGHFSVERLTAKAENKDLIKSFKAPEKGFKLGEYLREKAWQMIWKAKQRSILLRMMKAF